MKYLAGVLLFLTGMATAMFNEVDPNVMEVVEALEFLGKQMPDGTVNVADLEFASSLKDENCNTCYGEAFNVTLHHIWETFDYVCGKTTCPFVQKVCALFHKYPKFASGFFIGRYHPGQRVAGYCQGTGACDTKEKRLNLTYAAWGLDIQYGDLYDKKDSLPAFNGPRDSVTAVRTLMQDFNAPKSLEDFYHDVEMKIEEGQCSLPYLKGGLVKPPVGCGCSCTSCKGVKDTICCANECVCHGCVKSATHHVAKAALAHAKKTCETTPCPVIKQWCEDAKQAQWATTGLVIAISEPWKYGVGYCYGKGLCKHLSCCKDAHHCAKYAQDTSLEGILQ